MEIFLIRHTQTAVPRGTCYGRSDVPLAATAASDIQATLANVPACDFVHSSTSSRCELLAQALALRDGIEPATSSALLELDFGDWEGSLWADIPRTHSDPWAEDPWEHSPPNGENERTMWLRVNRWFNEELQPRSGRHAVIAHGGSLRILRCLILGLSASERWEWQIASGEVVPLTLPG